MGICNGKKELEDSICNIFCVTGAGEGRKDLRRGRRRQSYEECTPHEDGEELTVNDGEGSQYLCAVESYEADMAVLKILGKKQDESELASKIYLFQGLPKQDKMELIVQKSVELGAYQVIPVATKRAVVKLDAKKAKKKVERWQQIAVSAAKQAGRGIIPEVGEVCTYAQALKQAEELDVVLIPYELAKGMEETKQIIAGIRPQSVGIFIGPKAALRKKK